MTRTQFAHHPGCFSQETPSRHLPYIYQCPFWLSKHISSNPIPVLVRSWSFCNAEDQGIRRSLLMAPSSGCTHPSAVLSQDDRHQSCKAHYSRCTIRIFARDWVLHCGRRGTWSRSRTSQAYHRGTCRPKGPEIQLEPCRPQGRLDTSFDPSGRWKCLPDMLSSWCRHQSGLGHRHTWAEARSALAWHESWVVWGHGTSIHRSPLRSTSPPFAARWSNSTWFPPCSPVLCSSSKGPSQTWPRIWWRPGSRATGSHCERHPASTSPARHAPHPSDSPRDRRAAESATKKARTRGISPRPWFHIPWQGGLWLDSHADDRIGRWSWRSGCNHSPSHEIHSVSDQTVERPNARTNRDLNQTK